MTNIDLFKVYNKLECYCLDNNLNSLSAIDLNYSFNVFVLKNVGSNFFYFSDCKYYPLKDCEAINSVEGFFRFKNSDGSIKRFEFSRFSCIKLVGQEMNQSNMNLENIEKSFFDVQAVLIQREVDNLSNLIEKKGKEIYF